MKNVVDFKGIDRDIQIESEYGQEMCIAHKAEIDVVKIWLKSALLCDSFKWDGDQYAAAEESVKYLEWLLGGG